MEKHLVYQFGRFQVDPTQKLLLLNDHRLPLTPKAFLILQALVEAGGQVVSKEDLMAKVWPVVVVEESNLTKNISILRKVLCNDSESMKCIETIPKIGYRFIVDVELRMRDYRHFHENGRIDPALNKMGEPPLSPVSSSGPASTTSAMGKTKMNWGWMAAGLGALMLCGIWFKWSSHSENSPIPVSEFAAVRLTNHIAMDEYPVYSPDGTQVAFTSNRDGLPTIYLMNTSGGNVRKLSDNLPGCYALQWLSNGKRIFCQTNSGMLLVDADGGKIVKLPDHFGLPSPDGKKTVISRALVPGVRGSEELFVYNVDGSHAIRLTHNDSIDTDPAWSPDNRRIAFTCFPDGYVEDERNNAEICMINANGGNLTRMTNRPGWDNWPIWSPDGTRIAFQSIPDRDNKPSIYVMNADGSNKMRLTDCEVALKIGGWSPDGKRIIYESERDGNREIYSINSDPSHQTNLTRYPAEDLLPVWSPDGKKILFTSNREGSPKLFVMNADGSHPRKVINQGLEDCGPDWSPDGTRIAFTGEIDGNRDIYVADADGGNIVRLTHNPQNESWPVWSPDGKKILYVNSKNELNQLYMMNTDGSGVTRISNSPEHEWQHDWSPDGRQIVFTRSHNRGVQRDLWMMNVDGSNACLIAAAPANKELLHPRFSPDGQRIAFQWTTTSPVSADIGVMNLGANRQTRLTFLSGALPAWSPDGKKIAFSSRKRTGNSDIYVMDVTASH